MNAVYDLKSQRERLLLLAQRRDLEKLTGTVNHMKRPEVDGKKPLHITWRLKDKLPSLRTKSLLKEFKKSARRARRLGLRLIHFSILRNHIHMIIEADNNRNLAAGMRSLGGRFGKIIRRNISNEGDGAVFMGRYHVHVLRSPREMRNALEYVLLNESKHLDLIEHIDPFSSVMQFQDWKTLLGRRFNHMILREFTALNELGPDETEADWLSPPKSWLGRVGWTKAA